LGISKASACKSRNSQTKQVEQKLQSVKEESPENDTKIKCTRLHSDGKGIIVHISINGVNTSGVIDTGADATVVSSHVAEEAGINTNRCKKKKKRKYVSLMRKMGRK
jgi:predicted aspartyl protease